ncbi:putative protein serine/threonine kinase [Cavenderia fasciculata]|uniref:Protein kinase domain-containing protein n=1 Tax=Cavenderia fasciculata TaxID=261658 RepID=F4PSD3_CACFS|nr:putative protein serine/threonine kinase [Cavenderia fasciculata]EGG20679.1 putative protein serine/threonine kinase [Cavenderia fasciculata]|eukprot:XP_004358529.1 putative protein serine/threonine kinase [Cavenderia fasciculata]
MDENNSQPHQTSEYSSEVNISPILTSFTFGEDYNQAISVGEIPSSILLLEFGDRYNQPLSVGVLPSSLQSLKFGYFFNQPLSDGVLPTSLLSLQFGLEFNQPLSVGVLPSSLQSLKFGWYYNQSISVGVLPSSLQSLKFGNHYNQPIPVGVLPSSLQSLKFGDHYNQRISVRVLPSSLQSLKFGYNYNHSISVGALPTSLQSLTFSKRYNRRLSVGVLPSSLQSLEFGRFYNQSIAVRVLPSSLQSLTFGNGYNQPLSVGVLPSSLQSLKFGNDFNQPLSVGVLPSSLQSLKIGDGYNQPLSFGVLPESLQSLVFGDRYNQALSVGLLPSSLQSLVFGYYYNKSIPVGVLPSLLSMKFGIRYNQSIPVGVLPSSLQSLKFGNHYNQPLSVGVLPSSLQSLEFGNGYNQALSNGVLPSSLLSLKFGGDSIVPIRFFVDFKKSISLSRKFLKTKSSVIKLPSIKAPLILSTTISSPSLHHLDMISEHPESLNQNPNSINCDPNYLMTYHITSTDFFLVNQHKYFKLHTFPYSANKVFLVMCQSSGELYVYKEIDYSINPKIYSKVQFEISTMQLFIGDDMNESQKQQPKPEYKYIPEPEIWAYIRRLFLILEKLSRFNIAHLDIKPLNIFIRHDGEIVLGDFGCCHYYVNQNNGDNINGATNNNHNQINNVDNQTNMIETTVVSRGTNGYYSPESKQKKYYSTSDIYSVGSTILHLLSCHPDDIANRIEFVKNHKNNNFFNADDIKISTKRYSEHLIKFVKNLLIATPHNRLSLDDLTGEIINQHTQRITSFLIDQRQILATTTTLILDGEFNSPLKGLLPETLLKLKLLGKFNQPIEWGDIPDSVETLIFGSSFNQDVKVIAHVQATIYAHLFCQIDKSKFESINQHFGEYQPESEYPLKEMEKLFELDEDNIHEEFEHNNQYLNIRLIYIKSSGLSKLKKKLAVLFKKSEQ